jgi:hypothetical protein
MILAGEVERWRHGPRERSGAEGLIVGDRVLSSNRQPPQDAVLH